MVNFNSLISRSIEGFAHDGLSIELHAFYRIISIDMIMVCIAIAILLSILSIN